MTNEVIIRKQQIKLNTSDEKLAFDCKQFLNEIANDELPKIYERIFYQKIHPESYVNIASIQIDLGVMSLGDFKNHFIKLVEQKIINELANLFEKDPVRAEFSTENDYGRSVNLPSFNQSVPLQYASEKQQQASALLFFLENGNYPWWYKKEQRKSPDDILKNFDAPARSSFLLSIVSKIKSLSTEQLDQILKRLTNYIKDAEFENYTFQIADLHADSSMKANIYTLINQTDQLIKLFKISKKVFFEHLLSFIFLKAEETDFIKRFLIRLRSAFPMSSHELKKRVEGINLNEVSVVNTISFDDADITYPDEKLSKTGFNFQKRKSADNLRDTGLYIENVGLILLHPFLPAFFKSLEITDEKGQFRSVEMQHRAAVLLYYLQSQDEVYLEWEMPFNKILCGIESADVIANGIELAESEKEEAIVLLKTVIDYWDALKGSSIEALQNTFFMRKGKITFKENHWLLQVERTGVDVLLDRLPWGISTVKLPWLKELIYTEW